MKTLRPQVPADLSSARRGAIFVFLVVGIVMLLAMAVITVDVASMQLARTELRAASDSAAKAGANALLRTQSTASARDAAIKMAALNRVGGKNLILKSEDIQIGTASQQSNGSWTFANGGNRPNSVRINAMMSKDSASGSVDLVFGKIFGAGSFQPAKTSTASVLQQEICLAIDRSASMSFDLSGVDWSYPMGGAYDKKPHATKSRWAALTKAVNSYVDIVSATAIDPRIAMVTWASDMTNDPLANLCNVVFTTIDLENPLNRNHQNLKDIVKKRGDNIILGGTNMAAGLDAAIDVLSGPNVLPFAKRNIILMTDGQWNMGRSPVLSAQDAADAGITIYVITFLPGANSADMDQVATMTGGVHYHANSEAELIAAFQELARTLPVVLTD